MSRSAAALVLALTGVAQAARAQAPAGGAAEARALLARADSLWTQLARRDSASSQRTYRERLARRFDAGPLTVLLPGSVGAETGRRVASGASHFLGGAIPPAYVAARVMVALAATGVDSTLRAEGLAARTRVVVDVAAQPDTFANGWPVAAALADSFRATLDTTWREWLPPSLALNWTLRREGRGAVRELMGGDTRAGADCLEGSVAGCRLWLGLDADTNPYRSRYRPEELRHQIASRPFTWRGAGALAGQCTAGSDVACVRVASFGLLPAIPAGPSPLGSLLDFVRTRQRSGALASAFADSAGSVGERLARTASVPEDSLVAEWRIWLLTGGGQPRVTADMRDALPVVLFGGLLLLAAARSGRWR